MIWWETTWKMQTLEPLTCSHQVQIAFCSWGWWGWRGRLVLPHHKQVRILAILVHLTIVWFDKPFPAEGEAKDEINSSSFAVIVPRCWSAGADQYLILRRSLQPYFFLNMGTSQMEWREVTSNRPCRLILVTGTQVLYRILPGFCRFFVFIYRPWQSMEPIALLNHKYD